MLHEKLPEIGIGCALPELRNGRARERKGVSCATSASYAIASESLQLRGT